MEPIDNRTPNTMEQLSLKTPERASAEQRNETGETPRNPEAAIIDTTSQAELAKSVASQPLGTGLPAQLPKVSPSANTGSQTTMVATPMSASDEDNLPKEWIDAAKQIISSTVDEPHKRDDEVTKLKNDYQQKRYGVNPPGSDSK